MKSMKNVLLGLLALETVLLICAVSAVVTYRQWFHEEHAARCAVEARLADTKERLDHCILIGRNFLGLPDPNPDPEPPKRKELL